MTTTCHGALPRVDTGQSGGRPGNVGDIKMRQPDDRAGSAQDDVAFPGDEAEPLFERDRGRVDRVIRQARDEQRVEQ